MISKKKKIDLIQNITSILVKADYELVYASFESLCDSENSTNCLLSTCKFLTTNLSLI